MFALVRNVLRNFGKKIERIEHTSAGSVQVSKFRRVPEAEAIPKPLIVDLLKPIESFANGLEEREGLMVAGSIELAGLSGDTGACRAGHGRRRGQRHDCPSGGKNQEDESRGVPR